MNFFDALNQGDGSLKEPNFTSILFYLFKETKSEFPNSSFLDFFIKSYLPHLPNSNECEFDFETDLKIEEILFQGNARRDSDITIYLKHKGQLNIINIENKVSNLSFQIGQIEQQKSLLESIYPNSIIYNVLLLPYSSTQISELNINAKFIYWNEEENSLIQKISEYIHRLLDEQKLILEKHAFLFSCLGFFQNFSNVLEQERLSSENMQRGPRNILRLTMFQYLTDIANNWEDNFKNDPDNVTVAQLLGVFEQIVVDDIRMDFPNNLEAMIDKFKRGALEAQPKIMTINEKNRIYFNITNPKDKNLFYYPDSSIGSYNGRWKNTRIKPLKRMNENEQYVIYWKNNLTNDVETTFYTKNQ